MSAPWPYPTTDGLHLDELPSKPTWECPDKTCQCQSPTGKRDKLEFSVLLVDENGASMGGARCRVHVNGIVCNDDEPYANEDGWITAVVDHAPESVLVEWAPWSTPDEPRYPFQRRYFVDLREEDPDEAARRRLHNLGFSDSFAMRENVCDFQEEYGYEVTGELDEIREDLTNFHDDPCLPETGEDDHDEVAANEPAFGLVAARPRTRRRRAPPKRRPDPKNKGNKKAGGGKKKPGQGTAKPKPPKVIINVFSFFSLGMTTPMRAGARPKKQRWGAGDAHPVKNAEIRFFDAAGKLQAQIPVAKVKPNGQAVLDLSKLPDGTYTLLLTPPTGHELRSGANNTLATGADRQRLIGTMVGPADSFTGDPVEHTRFRMLEVSVEVKAAKLALASLPADMFVTLAPGISVSHGGILLETPTILWIDYKPDFVQIKASPEGAKSTVNRPGTSTPLPPTLFIHLHHTHGATPGSTLDEFTRTNEKGAHYLVDVDGFVVKLTNERLLARHTGKGHWYDLDSAPASPQKSIDRFNDLSVGIEQVNRNSSYPAAQIAGTNFLVGRMRSAFGTSQHNVLGDGDTAMHDRSARLGRKFDCPGPTYDWTVLERAGNATQPSSSVAVPHARYGDIFSKNPASVINASSPAAVVSALQQTLAELGYFVVRHGRFDDATTFAVLAFQHRYFSGPSRASDHAVVTASGGADLVTVTRMHEVLAARGGFEYV